MRIDMREKEGQSFDLETPYMRRIVVTEEEMGGVGCKGLRVLEHDGNDVDECNVLDINRSSEKTTQWSSGLIDVLGRREMYVDSDNSNKDL